MIDWLVFGAALIAIFATAKLSAHSIKGRIVSLITVMLGATMVVLGSLRLVPGDPIDHILGDQAQASSRELLAKELGLSDVDGHPISFAKQYSAFLQGIMTNSVKSFHSRRNTLDIVFERLPYTIFLALFAMAIALTLGPLLGILASFFRNKWPDHLFSVFALIGVSIPSFFLGPLLLLLLAIYWPLLPISGADDGIRSVILPALSMGTALAAMLARMSRASMLEVLSEDFIRTAYAKGLSRKVVFLKHALRNALVPVVTILGLQFGAVLSGAVVTEKIFNWPGIGLLLLESIQSLDMPMVQTCVLVIASIYAIINMATDLLYRLIDPRINFVRNNK